MAPMIKLWMPGIAALALIVRTDAAEPTSHGRKAVVLDSQVARLVVDLAGGAIGEFRLKEGDVNPLSWAAPRPGDISPQGFGHFLCLDRWGPPSEAEGARGMPYHGEASHVVWNLDRDASENNGVIEAQMTAKLPKAGLSIRRIVSMPRGAAAFTVREEVSNENALGRIFNMVQHPSIGPPFLDESTIVDCNGQTGFAQGGNLPNPEEPSSNWPRALKKNGEAVDLRHLAGDPNPNVVSYAIEGKDGWVTAATPTKGVLIGYFWKTSDYPWVSLWREVHDGKPAARGLEFGTTGLHQPYPILVRKGRIWDRPLFEYLDAGETKTKSYTGFLVKIPADFNGVKSLKVESDRITLLVQRSENKESELSINLR